MRSMTVRYICASTKAICRWPRDGSIPMTAFATSEVVSRINSLQTLVMGIITAAGAIVLAWGVFDFAAGYQAHDTSQQTQSLKKVISGILMCGASTVISLVR